MTVESAAMMTADEAQRATERIRLALDRVSTAWADLGERIADAYQRRADLALGYGSWAEYAEAELKPAEGLAAEVRRQLVGMLSQAGMSTRAIAPTVGVSPRQAAYDVEGVQSLHTSTPDPLAEEKAEGRVVKLTGPGSLCHSEPDRIDYDTGEVLDETPVAPTVTGLDGKTYKRPEPNFQRRAPLPEAIASTVYDVARKVERLERMVADDRLPQNRDKIAVRSHSDLVRIIDALQRVADQINPNQE